LSFDSGRGIDPEIIQEGVKAFFTTRERSTGLGLSNVRSIVETHGGTIELLNNDPPPGLTARISLPLYQM
jgi:signal transduction histidine kinase